MDHFSGCETESEIKRRWRELCKQHHPDMPGGDTATMQAINAAYETMLRGEYKRQGMDDAKANARWRMDQEIAAKVAELLKLGSLLKIEICGVWVWVTGETYAFKDRLKNSGCRWSREKSAWYWRKAVDGGRRYSRGRYTLPEIRHKYGSDVADDRSGQLSLAGLGA